MRGSILYLAIVAIWAGFLVPAWLRRPHASSTDAETDVDADADDADVDGRAGAEWRAGAESGEFTAEFTAGYSTDTEGNVEADFEADIHIDVSRRNQEYRDDVPEHAETGTHHGAQPASRPEALPSQSREQMLRARRRMLTILAALTVITGGFAIVGQVHWWICVPPAGMLVLYVLLLREIAMADAELARKRAAWEARAAHEQERAAQAERDAWTRQAAEPGAQIIDISGRVGDQLYDQYADAAVRAVGD